MIGFATIQVVQVDDGIECELASSNPLAEGGPYEIIVISDVPAKSLTMHNKLVLVPVDAAIELTEEPGPPFEMRDNDEPATRRWVSDWEVIDE